MTQEALKLALEALENHTAIKHPQQIHYRDKAITAIKEALAQEQEPPPWWPAVENILTEYGLQAIDFVADFKNALAQTQEPVAWIHNFIEGGISIGKRPADLNRHPDRWTALYKEPKPCPTCESLARTVMLDQTSHDTPHHRINT